MPTLVGRKAPDFTAAAVLGNGEIINDFRLYDVIKEKYCVLFFYPLDFTFVCPTEIIAADKRVEAFSKRDTVLIGISIDSQFTHNAWRETPRSKGGIGKIRYPLVADVNHAICQSYGVEHPEAGIAFRGTFIIDTAQIIQVSLINNLPIGRDFDEIIRLIDAVRFVEKHGEVCPANWKEGASGMKPTPSGVASYIETHEEDL